MTGETNSDVITRLRFAGLEQRIRLAAQDDVPIDRDVQRELHDHGVCCLELCRSLQRAVIMKVEGSSGEWQCIIIDPERRLRDIASVTVLLSEGRIWVLEIYWDTML